MRGERATPQYLQTVLSWVDYEVEALTGEERDRPRYRKVIQHVAPVFNYSRTYQVWDGLPKAVRAYKDRASEMTPERSEDIARTILNGMVHPPILQFEYVRPMYNPQFDVVGLPKPESFPSKEIYYWAAFHEYCHSTGHPSRLSRFEENCKPAAFNSESYTFEELTAEIASSTLAATVGINMPSGVSAEVCQNWTQVFERNQIMVYLAAEAAQNAVDYLLQSWG